MADLLAFVRIYFPAVSPESTSRTMRNLRQFGKINYQVIDRNRGRFKTLPDQVTQADREHDSAMGASN
jgi:hypothetical protein